MCKGKYIKNYLIKFIIFFLLYNICALVIMAAINDKSIPAAALHSPANLLSTLKKRSLSIDLNDPTAEIEHDHSKCLPVKITKREDAIPWYL